MSNKLLKVPFHGNDVLAVEKDGRIYVAMKPICEAIGLDWSCQLRNIKNDKVLQKTMVVMTIVAGTGSGREMVCLPLEYLNGWLFKVPASRYTGEQRKVIMLYQKECYQALYDYWHNGGAVNSRLDEQQAGNVIGRIAEAGEGRFGDTLISILQAVAQRLDLDAETIRELDRRNGFLENFCPKTKPFQISDITGRSRDRYVRGYFTSNKSGKLIASLGLQLELPL